MDAHSIGPASVWCLAPAWLSLAALLGACSVREFDPQTVPPQRTNTCTSDVDCKSSEVTSNALCGAGFCVAVGTIDDAILEVVPTASAIWGAGESFLLDIDELRIPSGGRSIALPNYVRVQGEVTAAPELFGDPLPTACEQAFDRANNSLAVHLQFFRAEAAQGLPSTSFAANATPTATGWKFDINLQPGRYDVYATALGGCDAEFPPILWKDRTTDAAELGLSVVALSSLSGTVKAPFKRDAKQDRITVSLADWTVSLVEPAWGRRISTTRKLNDSNPTNFLLRYMGSAPPLLRLDPPEGVVAPYVLWDLAILDLDGDGQVGVDLSALDVTTVRVSGSTLDADTEPLPGAMVRIRSASLTGALQGLSARFETQLKSDDNGQFAAELLPGVYDVTLTPPDESGLAITKKKWEIAKSPAEQAGRTLVAQQRELLQGVLLDPVNSAPMHGVVVTASPSSVVPASFLERSLAPAAATPRLSSGTTNADGWFGILVDPGRFDLAAKPAPSSAYPWWLSPRTDSSAGDLGPHHAAFPVPLQGVLTSPGGYLLQRALMRVYVRLASRSPLKLAGPNDTSMEGVLLVAEGRTNDKGEFTLLLPSTLE